MRKSKKLVVKRQTVRTLIDPVLERANGARYGNDCTCNNSGCWTGGCEDDTICCGFTDECY